MRALVLAGICVVALGGCATNTESSWACKLPRGVGGSCNTIAENDQAAGEGKISAPLSNIEGAQVVRWWSTPPWSSLTGPGVPAREGDQVMRVVFAPFVDRVGDYYPRSEVFAVMRPGGWWGPAATPPSLVQKPAVSAAEQ